MPHKVKLLGAVVASIAVVLALVYFIILMSPTPAPSQKSIDYLRIVRSLSAVQSRVEAQKLTGGGVKSIGDIDEVERRKIIEESGGLIRQVNIRPNGALAVQARMATGGGNESTSNISVHLLLTPEKSGEKYEWRCFGEPVSALPSFCEKQP